MHHNNPRNAYQCWLNFFYLKFDFSRNRFTPWRHGKSKKNRIVVANLTANVRIPMLNDIYITKEQYTQSQVTQNKKVACENSIENWKSIFFEKKSKVTIHCNYLSSEKILQIDNSSIIWTRDKTLLSEVESREAQQDTTGERNEKKFYLFKFVFGSHATSWHIKNWSSLIPNPGG